MSTHRSIWISKNNQYDVIYLGDAESLVILVIILFHLKYTIVGHTGTY